MEKQSSRSATAHTGGSSHYQELKIQPWDVMASSLTYEEFKGFLKGCALKRLMRANSKGAELEDMKKAHHELGHLIYIMENHDGTGREKTS